MSRELAARGKAGSMEMQQCDACGAVFYPPREICPGCLSGEVSWRPCDNAGKILAASILSHSFDADIAAKLPLSIVSVKLNAGPVVIAYAGSQDFDPGDKVCLTVEDAAGGPALVASRDEGK